MLRPLAELRLEFFDAALGFRELALEEEDPPLERLLLLLVGCLVQGDGGEEVVHPIAERADLLACRAVELSHEGSHRRDRPL